jgi:tripartite-type tricarboxylate transporter receptor subunit TctC
MGHVARSEPDGYTILLATNAYSVNVTLYNKIPYDAAKDFVGVCELASSPNTFVVKSELPAKTMKEFVALAKASPDKFNVSSPPIGTTPQIQTSVLKIRENLPHLQNVVFKGGGEATNAILGGSTPIGLIGLGNVLAQSNAGKMTPLALGNNIRSTQLPDVPTLEELGIKGYDKSGWHALFAPKGTPAEIINRINAVLNKALASTEMKLKLAAIGADADGGPPERLTERMRAELREWAEVIRLSGATVE